MGYILITRPEEDAKDFAEDVRQAGFQPLIAPMLNIAALKFDVPDLVDYQALLFTSANAVRVFTDRCDDRNIPVYTVGTRTAQVAQKAGFETVYSAEGTGLDLVDLVTAELRGEGGKLLHVRGVHVAVDVDDLLNDEGFGVDTLVVYEARPADDISAEIRGFIKAGDVEAVTFFSKRTAEQFIKLVQKHNLEGALTGIKSLCISASVLEYVQVLSWQETYKSVQPDRAALLELLKNTCTNPRGEFMQGDDEEKKSMSAKKKSAAIDNAGEVIERFGGIRPMAKKIDVAVTTIQGWKKRDTIPAGRREQILEAAEEYKVDLSDLLKGAPSISSSTHANENTSSTASASSEPEEVETPEAEEAAEPVVLSERAPSSVPPTSATEEKKAEAPKASPRTPLDERFAETEKKAVTKSTWINFTLLILGLIAVAVLLLTGGPATKDSEQRLGALEQDVDQLRGDVDSVKAEQSFLSTLVPKDLDARIQRIQDQAMEAQQKVNQAIATAGAVSNDILGEDAGTLEERIEKVQAYSTAFTGSPQIQSVLERLQAMSASAPGQNQLDAAVSELSMVLNGGADNLDTVLETARDSTPSVGEAFEGVPANELKAAALLLGMTQMRSALNRDNEAFADDLQLMKNLLGAEEVPEGESGNAALMEALDKLAPKAQEGVLTPAGLTAEFRSIAGDTVVASLKGEDVSFQDKVKARFGELLQVEKEGELVSGTPTQATVSKAEKMLEEGDVAGAIMAVESLEGPAADVAAPWLEEARATLLAQSLKDFIDGGVSSVSAGGAILPAGSKLIRNEEAGINILVPETKRPSLFDAP